jgi:hypothetical protein
MTISTNRRRPVIIGPDTPNWPKSTDIWFNTTDNTVSRYNSATSQWDAVGSNANAIIAQIVGSAPATLDTLDEIAQALSDNPNILDLYLAKSTYASASANFATTASLNNKLDTSTYASASANFATTTQLNNKLDTTTYAAASAGFGAQQATSTTLGTVFGATNSSNKNTSLGYTDKPEPTGEYNIRAGYRAMGNSSTGNDNIVLGQTAGQVMTSGSQNVFIGRQSAYSVTTSSNSVLIGTDSGILLTTGGSNVGIGTDAIRSVTTGGSNIGIGSSSLYLAGTSSSNNTAIGTDAGYNLTSGQNNTFVGFGAQPSSGTVSNTITLGNSSISALRCQVQSITSLSDERDKTNIEPLSVGLDFVNSLNPVKFEWNMRDETKVGEKDFGFIAQQIVESEDSISGHDWLKLTLRDNPDKLEATQGRLIPILVKAIQELSAEVQALKSQLA